jgi:AhpD family alkylhydroperoxidase
MSRIPYVAADDEPDELRPVFDQLRTTRGRVPGMYRTLAHQPAVLTAHRAYFNAALDQGILPRKFKEKIAFKVAHMRGSAYSTASHREYALKHGVPESEIEAIAAGDFSPLPENERAALVFACAMIDGRGEVPDEIFDACAAHFPPAEMVEIITLTGIMELASMLGAVFKMQPD